MVAFPDNECAEQHVAWLLKPPPVWGITGDKTQQYKVCRDRLD
jgi:hypothetical protein